MSRMAIAVLAACALITSSAEAGTFRAGEFGKGGDIALTYLALPGESNAVRAR